MFTSNFLNYIECEFTHRTTPHGNEIFRFFCTKTRYTQTKKNLRTRPFILDNFCKKKIRIENGKKMCNDNVLQRKYLFQNMHVKLFLVYGRRYTIYHEYFCNRRVVVAIPLNVLRVTMFLIS